mmetsp:Transcript_22791/g.66358  ORF Transcript_22791/g.66358 Transcript_22791/m.66358 type:complete len:206 (-) Transcript_22791:174-791(-)|eukprot:CAMPEP_0118982280 /NCGR_PEP_ID=MMETSP1173-20130426/32435_1 /TAXON_ID=1034831 /ORGANISM="Rhizochromulina marina cf, Strain CCMP1243" /LENGTH=205 /DNA_ID=CAMNT_0006932755 /DNA_START=245 /DNA_END=862 /DNA_ORIENTATION=-
MTPPAGRGYSHLVKLLLIGDSAVGKSSVLLRYADDQFTSSFITTIGIDFKIKSITLDGKRVKLQIWDTAGQERFKTITTAYYRGAMGIILVYDVTNRTTFQNVQNWMRQIELHAAENVNKIIIANKCDVDKGRRQVSFEEGKALADEYGVKFFETSAKGNIGVTESFESIASDVVNRLADELNRNKPGVQVTGSSANNSQKASCC